MYYTNIFYNNSHFINPKVRLKKKEVTLVIASIIFCQKNQFVDYTKIGGFRLMCLQLI